jgi:rubrerythrin
MDNDIRKIIEYMWEDEQRHWEESGQPNEHIFMAMRRTVAK